MSTYPVQLPKENALLTITHPSSFEWIIELHNGEDNRLSEQFIESAILPALDYVERDWLKSPAFGKAEYAKGALMIVGRRSQDKFFSNGLQYEQILKKPEIITNTYNVLISRLLSFPIPVIAAINGHCFAGGFLLAMACDYRVIRSDKHRRIWGSMNEIHFGAPFPPSFSALLTRKVGDQRVLRKIVLEGHRFTPSELLEAGLVDRVVDGDTETLLRSASEIAEKWSVNATTGVWGLLKQGLVSNVIQTCNDREAKANFAKPRL